MSNIDAVRKWRIATKKRIVESMGGCCQICGYKSCTSALETHHINPEEKDFGLGGIRANPKSWEKIVKELRKCILLCSNCHRECHDGLVEMPLNYDKFDESYINYKHVGEIEPCPVCLTPKPSKNKTCSLSCAAKLSGKVDWDNIDLEYLLKKHKTYSKVGDELGISDVAVIKRCKKLGIEKRKM